MDCDGIWILGLFGIFFVGYIFGLMIFAIFDECHLNPLLKKLKDNFEALKISDEEESRTATYRPKIVQYPSEKVISYGQESEEVSHSELVYY